MFQRQSNSGLAEPQEEEFACSPLTPRGNIRPRAVKRVTQIIQAGLQTCGVLNGGIDSIPFRVLGFVSECF